MVAKNQLFAAIPDPFRHRGCKYIFMLCGVGLSILRRPVAGSEQPYLSH